MSTWPLDPQLNGWPNEAGCVYADSRAKCVLWTMQSAHTSRNEGLIKKKNKQETHKKLVFIEQWLWRPCFARIAPPFLFTFNLLFSKPLFSAVVPAMVLLCKCVTHSLPFHCLRSLLTLVFINSYLLRARAVFPLVNWGRDRLSLIFRVNLNRP